MTQGSFKPILVKIHHTVHEKNFFDIKFFSVLAIMTFFTNMTLMEGLSYQYWQILIPLFMKGICLTLLHSKFSVQQGYRFLQYQPSTYFCIKVEIFHKLKTSMQGCFIQSLVKIFQPFIRSHLEICTSSAILANLYITVDLIGNLRDISTLKNA